ncbi:MAG TPA: hypothetical protein VMU99_07340 [Acidimicrobiales bacterium]|nr:hypothetical protein [Acidimicrobiales bacterium]
MSSEDLPASSQNRPILNALDRRSPGTHYMVSDYASTLDESIRARSVDNFSKVFAIGPEDRVLLLLDNAIDPRVVRFIWEFARGRGAETKAVTLDLHGISGGHSSVNPAIPEDVKPLCEWATFVVSTWFSSASNPYFNRRRREGQRWVKITYFRNLDMLNTEAAAFPLDVISLLLSTTAQAYPSRGEALIHVTDPRGTDLVLRMDESTVQHTMNGALWKGQVMADHPGCYVHYLTTHGPNFYGRVQADQIIDHVDGILVPQWSVGFPDYFDQPVTIALEDNRVVKMDGSRTWYGDVLEEMLIGSRLIELGCGFNPKWPRDQVYPAGTNSPGGIHFGMDLIKESRYIKEMMPDWPEPPVHMDLVDLDATITVNGATVVENGRLSALDDPKVRECAGRYGSPEYLLDSWPFITGH